MMGIAQLLWEKIEKCATKMITGLIQNGAAEIKRSNMF